MNLLENRLPWSGLQWPETESETMSTTPQAAIRSGVEARWTAEQAADWREWDIISMELWIPQGQSAELTLEVSPLQVGRPEYASSVRAIAAIVGRGWTPVEIARSAFDAMSVTSAMWRMVRRLTVQVKLTGGDGGEAMAVRRLALKRSGRISLQAERRSLVLEPGQTALYDVLVRNESDDRQAVALKRDVYGFESTAAEIEPAVLELAPGQARRVAVRAAMHDGIAPGGYEKLTVSALPNGDSAYAERLALYIVRKLPRPYILHTEAGWERVKRNAEQYGWARRELEAYVRRAEAWVVPEAKGAGQPYAFELGERFQLHAAGVAWKLTGRREFQGKAMLLLRRLADPVNGYPETDAPMLHIYASREEQALPTPRAVKVCGGGLIHEGEFMLDVASVYDLLHDAEGWTEEDHRRIEAAFRLFIEKVDWMITDGDMNNIPSGGMIGALLCSLAIQDMRWIRRFVEGPGGFIDMVATGVMDDGWYFEGATNYVLLFADMFTRLIQACEPWGFNLKHLQVPPSYRRNAMLSPWSMPGEKPFLGMSFAKFGPVRRNARSVRDVWDAMLPFVDERGILIGHNDSTDKDVVRAYDLAYYVWRDPKYASVVKGRDRRDLLYGEGELPEHGEDVAAKSAYADNVGLAVLRSGSPEPGSRIEAVVKYGSHGGYHGHFDRTGLVALKRYGKNAYGPLASWYGYDSFMFKMWVQASLSHNMVVADGRMQEPAESQRLLFHSGRMLQVCAVETTARWSDPPYGGQTPYPASFPEEKGWAEGRYVPAPPVPRGQGDPGEYSEPILQRRLTAVTDDYVLIADYVRGGEEHVYDCLHHYQGFAGLRSERTRHLRHTGKMFEDPYGAGQFITDCDWYACAAPVVVSFSHEYDRVRDDEEGRHMAHNENGRMELNVHALWPPEPEMMTGWYAEAAPVNKRLHYEVLGDGELLDEGRFGAWILGKRRIAAPLRGRSKLELRVRTEGAKRKTVFWGDPVIVLADGRRLPLSSLPVRKSNVDDGNGSGVDYYGGPVHLEGEPYPAALPFEPLDERLPATAEYDLSELDAVSFEAVIGGDYPLGVDPARRKTVSVRATGKEAVFLTILEPHKDRPAVAGARALSEDRIEILLADGRRQELELRGLRGPGSGLGLRIAEWRGGALEREESAGE